MIMIITQYLFKNLFKTTLFITVVITAAIWLTQSLKLLEFVTNTAAPFSVFAKMMVLTIPKFLEVILPLSLSISILFVYNKFIMDNELIVMRSCGFSQRRLALPAITLAIATSIFITVLSTWATPVSLSEAKSLRMDLRTKYSSFLLREGVFNTFSNKFTVYLRSRARNGDLLGLMIHDYRDKSKPPVTITAKRGKIVTDSGVPNIIVFDGMRQQIDKNSGQLTKLYFQKYTIEVKGLTENPSKIYRKEKERTLFELLQPKQSPDDKIYNKHKFIAEAHKRLITPWNSLAFAMIAISAVLLGPFKRRGQTARISIGVVLMVLFQSLSLTFTNFAKGNLVLLPLLYINTFIPIAVGFYLLSTAGDRRISTLFKRLIGAKL